MNKLLHAWHILRDGAKELLGRLVTPTPESESLVRWNPDNLVVQDHRTGEVDLERTNQERAARGLIVPWTPEIGAAEARIPRVN